MPATATSLELPSSSSDFGNGGAKFLILANEAFYAPTDLQHRLQTMGLSVGAECFYTSAMAAARFLHSQRPKGAAFAIGESELTSALHEIGYILSEHDPDYVVIDNTSSYNCKRIPRSVRLATAGARFIATNSDLNGPGPQGLEPPYRAVYALIQAATGRAPYFVGKPNPLMMRTALCCVDEHSENTIMVGDRMDTNIIGGIKSGMDTILVLTGIAKREDVERFPYRPTRIVSSVAEIEVGAPKRRELPTGGASMAARTLRTVCIIGSQFHAILGTSKLSKN